MSGFLKGYISQFRDMVNKGNDSAFLSLPGNLPLLVLVCGAIGLVRNALHVGLDTPIFYSFTPDLLWTMFFWPIHLFLFPSALLHGQLRLMGYRKVTVESVFGLAFHLQILHLIVPFFDWLGFAFGLPWSYRIFGPVVATDWYINFLVMTPGIILVWIITGYFVAKVLKKRFGLSWAAIMATSIVTFIFILVPIYFVWPTFNTLFNQTFGLLVWDPQDPRLEIPRQIQWGYGTYMAVTALLGAFYYVWWRRQERIANS